MSFLKIVILEVGCKLGGDVVKNKTYRLSEREGARGYCSDYVNVFPPSNRWLATILICESASTIDFFLATLQLFPVSIWFPVGFLEVCVCTAGSNCELR